MDCSLSTFTTGDICLVHRTIPLSFDLADIVVRERLVELFDEVRGILLSPLLRWQVGPTANSPLAISMRLLKVTFVRSVA